MEAGEKYRPQPVEPGARLPRQIIFLHIARTGGSTVWWHLAHTYSSRYHIGDIYHESRQRFGNAHESLKTVAALQSDFDSLVQPLFLHHHTLFPIDRLLPDAKFVLYLRDPIARFISYYKHNIRFFSGDKAGPYGDFTRQTLLGFARRHPGPLNPLTNYFYNSILYQRSKSPKAEAFEKAAGEKKLNWTIFGNEIMPFVEKFFEERVLFVGFQDQLRESVADMDEFFGFPRKEPDLERINDSSEVQLLPRDIEKLSAIEEKLNSLCCFDAALFAYAKKWEGSNSKPH